MENLYGTLKPRENRSTRRVLGPETSPRQCQKTFDLPLRSAERCSPERGQDGEGEPRATSWAVIRRNLAWIFGNTDLKRRFRVLRLPCFLRLKEKHNRSCESAGAGGGGWNELLAQ